MRLHRLEISAFGPFAGDVDVDFDALSGAGLFLLTGPTGSGKTSVLDAVCFALYGDVPGDRATAKRLRADQAEPGRPPRVLLECTLAGRRFRVVRSPAWIRPKRRGIGTTPQPATVTLTERVDGQWQPLSSRLDEAGQLVGELLGMNLTQFTQVAMLPQGRFQAFLRARSEDRHRLLQQLFRTSRFERVERWLGDRRRALGALSRQHEEGVADLVSRVCETAGAEAPEDELLDWARTHQEAALTICTAAGKDLDAARRAERAAAQALTEARAVADRQARLSTAREEQLRLAALADEVAEQRVRLDRARRASIVPPAHRAWRSAVDAVTGAQEEVGAAMAAAVATCGRRVPLARRGERHAWDGARQEAARALGEADAARPDEARLELLRERHRAESAIIDDLDGELHRIQGDLKEAPRRITALRERRDQAAEATAALPGARERVTLAHTRHEAARRLPELRAELEAAQDLLRTTTDQALALRERWLSLQEQRITGMAAELAGTLAVGACCPVCGSAEHPEPARPALGSPTAAAEKRARRAVDDAESLRHVHLDAVRALETQLATTEVTADGRTPSESGAEHARAVADLARVEDLAGSLATLTADLGRAEEDAAAAVRAEADLARRLSGARSTHQAHAQEEERLTTRVAALLAPGDDSLDALIRRLEAEEQVCARAAEALRAEHAAQERAAGARLALEVAVAEAGFDTVEDAVAAVLPPGEQARLDDELGAHEARSAAVRRVLEDPDLATADRLDPPDLAASEAAAEAATEALHTSVTDWERHRHRAQRLTELLTALDEALEAWRPVQQELELAVRMSTLAEGRAADNRLQMRLSAYVLGYRLSQVVAAANERLARMSDRRYSLEHTTSRGAGETRGGLSLLVRDDWSGESRDPATLSGGETFVVSLALALGLADVIAHEAGGVELETLFVDEGFGALDADTLEDVLDTLDSLREGGRVVGLVSHVTEMKDRIPTQLAVVKDRSGSRLRLSAAGG